MCLHVILSQYHQCLLTLQCHLYWFSIRIRKLMLIPIKILTLQATYNTWLIFWLKHINLPPLGLVSNYLLWKIAALIIVCLNNEIKSLWVLLEHNNIFTLLSNCFVCDRLKSCNQHQPDFYVHMKNNESHSQ